MRLFAALEVPRRVRAPLDVALAELRVRWDDLRWTPPEQWHVTIAFVGHTDRDPDEVAGVLAEAARNAPARVRLSIEEPGRFGARVLWVRVGDEPPGAVRELGAAAQDALEHAGLPVDRKEVRPHLTLARAARGRRRGVGPDVVQAVPDVEITWDAEELLILASVPQGHRQPNRYEPQTRLRLGPQ